MDTLMDVVHSSLDTSGFDSIPPRDSLSVLCHLGAPFLLAGAHSHAPACVGISPGLQSSIPPLPRHLPKTSDPEASPYSPPVADGEVSALYTAPAPAAVPPVVLPFSRPEAWQKGLARHAKNNPMGPSRPLQLPVALLDTPR